MDVILNRVTFHCVYCVLLPVIALNLLQFCVLNTSELNKHLHTNVNDMYIESVLMHSLLKSIYMLMWVRQSI